MLKNVKSSYILKYIFYHIDEGQKLRLVIYNKSLQKKLSISLNNYKFFHQKYIIFEENGKGKEYYGYYNILVFEGEYLNKVRNGKGKEYWGDRIEFEGNYLNGKRNGIGIEYYSNGNIKFEGEYLNGKRNGLGKEYFDGKLIFKGIYINGERNERKEQDYNYDKELIHTFFIKNEYFNGNNNDKDINIIRQYDKLNNQLLFEMEYFKREKKVRGKEYWNNKLDMINLIIYYMN